MSEKTFCQLADEAVKDEEEAQDFYERLKDRIKKDFSLEKDINNVERQTVLLAIVNQIKNQEKTHKELLERLKELHCTPSHRSPWNPF